MKKIFVVGSLNMDLVINAPYMPIGGETLIGNNFMTNCGGKGANQAAASGKLGGDVYMCGVVGNDEFGKKLISTLKEYNVNTDYIRTEKDVSTGIAVIVVTNGENRIILDKGANAYLKKEDIDTAFQNAEKGDIYLTQLESPIQIVGYGLKKAKEKGLITILNPAPANKDISEYFKYVDLITPNESELNLFGGKEELFSKGINKIITTLGSKGYEISDKKSNKIYPCIKVKVVDTTAAGDTACGGLAVGMASGKSIEDSMAFGSISASIACSKEGAMKSIPRKEEVINFINK